MRSVQLKLYANIMRSGCRWEFPHLSPSEVTRYTRRWIDPATTRNVMQGEGRRWLLLVSWTVPVFVWDQYTTNQSGRPHYVDHAHHLVALAGSVRCSTWWRSKSNQLQTTINFEQRAKQTFSWFMKRSSLISRDTRLASTTSSKALGTFLIATRCSVMASLQALWANWEKKTVKVCEQTIRTRNLKTNAQNIAMGRW